MEPLSKRQRTLASGLSETTLSVYLRPLDIKLAKSEFGYGYNFRIALCELCDHHEGHRPVTKGLCIGGPRIDGGGERISIHPTSSEPESESGRWSLEIWVPCYPGFHRVAQIDTKSITGKSCNAFSDLTSVESLRSFLGSLQNNLILTDYSLEMSLNGSSVLPDADKWSLERNYLVSDRPHFRISSSPWEKMNGDFRLNFIDPLHLSVSFRGSDPEESYDYEYSYNAPAFHITWRKHDVFEVVYNEESHRFSSEVKASPFLTKFFTTMACPSIPTTKSASEKIFIMIPDLIVTLQKAILVQSDDAFRKVVIKDTRGM